MAYAPMVLSTDFLDDCLEQRKLVRPEDYILRDPEGEKRHSLKLKDVSKRAKANKGRLLRGQAVYCTEHVYGGFDTYKSIIQANGGRGLLYRARAGSITSAKAGYLDSTDDDDEPEEPEHVYLISGGKAEEQKLWPKFSQMVESIWKVPRIVRTDWMLDLALSQEIRWDESYEVTPDAEGDD